MPLSDLTVTANQRGPYTEFDIAYCLDLVSPALTDRMRVSARYYLYRALVRYKARHSCMPQLIVAHPTRVELVESLLADLRLRVNVAAGGDVLLGEIWLVIRKEHDHA